MPAAKPEGIGFRIRLWNPFPPPSGLGCSAFSCFPSLSQAHLPLPFPHAACGIRTDGDPPAGPLGESDAICGALPNWHRIC